MFANSYTKSPVIFKVCSFVSKLILFPILTVPAISKSSINWIVSPLDADIKTSLNCSSLETCQICPPPVFSSVAPICVE